MRERAGRVASSDAAGLHERGLKMPVPTFHSLGAVREDELRNEIAERRRVAAIVVNPPPPGPGAPGGEQGVDPPDPLKSTRESLVGLAFSGGGVRAAAFGLGVLQAFYRARFMRYIDYLSTVSGGGFVGSLFTSLVNHPAGKTAWTKSQIDVRGKAAREPIASTEYTIEDDETGRQPMLVRRLSSSGPKLRQPIRFLSAYFYGLFLTNIVAISGLLAVCALAAYLFQQLGSPPIATFIGALGFNDDVKLAFFPAVVMLVLWSFCSMVGNALALGDAFIIAAQWLFRGLAVAFAMALASLIGSGEINFNDIGQWIGFDKNSAFHSNSTIGRTISVIVLLVALMPYLRVRELVRSGVQPKNFRDRWIFAIASRALLYGIPFLVFGWFARENYSAFNKDRPIDIGDLTFSKSNMLYPSFFSGAGWDQFWLMIETSGKASSPRSPSTDTGPTTSADRSDSANNRLRDQIDRCLWDIANGQLKKDQDDRVAQARSRLLASIDKLRTEEKASIPSDSKEVEETKREARREANQTDNSPPNDNSNVGPTEDFVQNPPNPSSPSKRGRSGDSPDESTIIDLIQSKQISAEAYDERLTLDKLIQLITIYSNDNSLRQNYESGLTTRALEAAICDRINYQFVSNPWMARELLNHLETPSNASANNQTQSKDGASKTDSTKNDNTDERSRQTTLDLIAHLIRSPAGALVRNLPDAANNEPLNQADATFKFLQWQYCKHVLLRMKSEGRSEDDKQWVDVNERLDKSLEAHTTKEHRQRDFEAIEAGIREFNLGVLETVLYPKCFRPQETVFASVVLAHDQQARLQFFALAAITWIVAMLLVNLNFASIHSYYQQVMSSIWIKKRPGNPSPVLLVELENTRVGAPYHLLHGTVSLPLDPDRPGPPRGIFLFSKRYCGGAEDDYLETAALERLDLATAMSVSGAAVTPAAVDNELVWTIMFLTNLRTGLWLAWLGKSINGLTKGLFNYGKRRPGRAWHVMLNACLPRSWSTLRFVYDGGVQENLGVEALLLRGCRLIIAVDAGEDGGASFVDFQQLVQRCRSQYGISIESMNADRDNAYWMEEMVPCGSAEDNDSNVPDWKFKRRLAKRSVQLFKITYPPAALGADVPALSEDKREGTLVYIKSALTRKVGELILGYARTQSDFPHDSTINQFYEPREFGAYRALGSSSGSEALVTLARFAEEMRQQKKSVPGAEILDEFLKGIKWSDPDRDESKAKEQAEQAPEGAENVDAEKNPNANESLNKAGSPEVSKKKRKPKR